MESDSLSSLSGMLRSVRSVGLTGQLLRGGAGSLLVKVTMTVLGIAVTIVLARVLGPADFGVYAFVVALVSVLAIPAQSGIPILVLRETAKSHADDDWGALRGLWRWAFRAVIVLAFGVAGVALLIVAVTTGQVEPMRTWTLAIGLGLVPLQAMIGLGGGILKGLRRVVLGQLPESVIRPGVLLVSLIAVLALGREGSFTARHAMAIHVAAAASAALVTAWLVTVHRPLAVGKDVVPVYDRQRWVVSVLPLALIGGMAVINTQADLLMLGVLRSGEEVGVYRVASQGAGLVSFGLSAFAMVVMPHFARLHARGDSHQLQRLATIGSRAMLALAIPAAFILVFFGEAILTVVFGEQYAPAQAPMAVLAVAHVFHAGFGVLGPLLNMTGHERDTAKGITIAAVSNIILNAVLIPRFGTMGASTATAITLLIWNAVLWFAVRRRLGLDSSALGLSFAQR